VSADGQLLWSQPAPYGFEPTPPKQSPDGKLVFYLDAAYRSEDGSKYDVEALKGKRGNEQHIIGANGETYYRSGSNIIEWRSTPSGVEVLRRYGKQIPGIPADAGVTQSGILWGSYSMGFVNTESGVIWLDDQEQVLGRIQLRYDPSRILAVDKDAIVYMCGAQSTASIGCAALVPGSEEPLWQVSLDPGKLAGGALVSGRLYVAMEEGVLYAIGQGDTIQAQGDDAQPPAQVTTRRLGPDAEVVSWSFEHDGGFASKPTVSATGEIYIAGDDGTLSAVDPQGDPLWTVQLPAKPVGPPGLGADGTLYQADKAGNLSAFGPDGGLNWRFEPPESKPATVGAVVGPDGVIYYTVAGSVQAVSPAGEGVWQTRAKTFRSYTPLQVSPSGDLLFFAEDVFDTHSGALLELDAPVDVDAYLVGEDGQLYLRAGNTLVQWQRSGSKVETLRTVQWNYQGLISQNSVPSQAGVTRDGTVWLLYTTPYGGSSRMVWLDLEGQILGTVQAPSQFGAAQVVGLRDGDHAAFVCGFKLRTGNSRALTIDCVALTPDAEAPVWQMELGKTVELRGGVLVPGRMYLSTAEGLLYAIGD
jgi:outer membrane protein assembly factor BamB